MLTNVSATQMSLNWKMLIYNTIDLYNGTLFDHQAEWSIYTCHKIDESWKYYANWKKPVPKDYPVCDSIYMKCLK